METPTFLSQSDLDDWTSRRRGHRSPRTERTHLSIGRTEPTKMSISRMGLRRAIVW